MTDSDGAEPTNSVEFERIASLESQVRTLRSVVMIMASVFAVCGGFAVLLALGVARLPRLRVSRIEAAHFILWDEDGQDRGRFEVQDAERARLVINRVTKEKKLRPVEPSCGPGASAVSIGAWGERGVIVVNEHDARTYLAGKELIFFPGLDGGPELMLGNTWDGHPRLSVRDTSENTFVHFPPLGSRSPADSVQRNRP